MILRELFAKLGLDVDAASFAKGELAASIVKASLTKLVDVASETTSKFFEVIQATAEYGKETREAAQATGLTTDSLQQLRGVTGRLGLDISLLDVGLFHLSRTIYAASKGGKEQSAVFAALKIKIKDSKGELKDTDEVMLGLATAFKNMPDGAKKTALAMEVFGRSGARLIPLLNLGEEGINDMRAGMSVMTKEQLEAGEDLIRTQNQLASVTKKLWRSAIAPLLPAITDLVKRYLAWRKANADIMKQRIQQYIGYLVTAVTKLADLFSFLVRNSAAVKAIVVVGLIYGAIAAFQALGVAGLIAAAKVAAAWFVALAPFLALAAIVTGVLLVFDDLRTYALDVERGSKKQHSLFGKFKAQLDDWLKPNANDPWFLTAIKSYVRFLERAIELVNEFDIVTGKRKPSVTSAARATAGSPTWKKDRLASGPMTEAEQAAADKASTDQSNWYDKMTAGIGGSLPGGGQIAARYLDSRQSGAGWFDSAKAAYGFPSSASSGASRTVIQAPVQIDVHQQPGEDAEALSARIRDQINEHWDQQMEAAAAEVGP